MSAVMAPAIKRVRAYFAAVNRTAQQAVIFDPAAYGSFDVGAPPAPWIDLGWVTGFERKSETVVLPLRTGSPAGAQFQARTNAGARVGFNFDSWGKLQLSLAAGTQQMNLLPVQSGAISAGSGGVAVAAVSLAAASTSTTLQVGAAASNFAVGSLVVVDVDYVSGSTGFVGSGASGAYLKSAVTDVDYVRRISLNVGRISAVANGVLTLDAPLLAGAPTAAMKVSPVLGFCDREGSDFFQEWSAVFVGEGQQGERVIWYYPRLQADAGIAEDVGKSSGGFEIVRLVGSFRALPITDAVDSERVFCFRSYLPASA